MATLYTDTLIGITYGIQDSKLITNNVTILQEAASIADKSYVRWEANGGVDLQLPSFKLTNRQMFWLCRMHAVSRKYHRSLEANQTRVPGISDLEPLQGFKEAFKCDKD